MPCIEGFRTYLVGHCKNKKNTVHKIVASIRTILYSAIREGQFAQEKNPFFQIQMEKDNRPRNKSIDIEDVWSYGWPDIEPEEYIFPNLLQHLLRGTRGTFDFIKKKTSLLKKIQEACEIETRLTTHVARHT